MENAKNPKLEMFSSRGHIHSMFINCLLTRDAFEVNGQAEGEIQ